MLKDINKKVFIGCQSEACVYENVFPNRDKCKKKKKNSTQPSVTFKPQLIVMKNYEEINMAPRNSFCDSLIYGLSSH